MLHSCSKSITQKLHYLNQQIYISSSTPVWKSPDWWTQIKNDFSTFQKSLDSLRPSIESQISIPTLIPPSTLTKQIPQPLHESKVQPSIDSTVVIEGTGEQEETRKLVQMHDGKQKDVMLAMRKLRKELDKKLKLTRESVDKDAVVKKYQ